MALVGLSNSVVGDDLLRRIRRVVAESGSLTVDVASLGDGDDLYEAGLKSLAAVHLMLALEAEFGIEFPNSVLNRSAFGSLARIRTVVAGVVADQVAASST